MIPLIQDNLSQIRSLCRGFGVKRLDLFGSAATGTFDPDRSDVDFLIEYEPRTDLGPWMRDYFELNENLEALLGRPVDLVIVEGLRSPYFIRSVNESRTQVFEMPVQPVASAGRQSA